jgi:hypothetical protein
MELRLERKRLSDSWPFKFPRRALSPKRLRKIGDQVLFGLNAH